MKTPVTVRREKHAKENEFLVVNYERGELEAMEVKVLEDGYFMWNSCGIIDLEYYRSCTRPVDSMTGEYIVGRINRTLNEYCTPVRYVKRLAFR